jgi:hypothetical protein
MTEDIIASIVKTSTKLKEGIVLPNQQGIYAFYVVDSIDLGKFGFPGQIIYAGLSEKSLNSRDTKTHLETGKTGWSSLRRSLGAILKSKLNLSAQKRDKNPSELRADKYKFDEEGEKRLTGWMMKNLKMGYWTFERPLTKEKLRNEEEKVLIKLRPTLDLDQRTKKFNPLADELLDLRKICREDVKIAN